MEQSNESSNFRKWSFVILGMAIFICLGTVYSWSIFKTPFEELYGINASLSGLPYLVFLVFYTVFMMISGKFVDRHSPRTILLLGGLLVGFGWTLSGVIKNFYAVIFFYGVVSGSGVGIAYGVPIKIVTNWFTKKKGLALGLLLSGFGLSPFITAPVIETSILHSGVNRTFIYVGIVFTVLIPLLGLFFKHPQSHHDHLESDYTPEPIKCLIFKREFIGLWITFVIGATVGLMIIGVSSQIGVQVYGINSQTTAFLISLFAVFNAVGRPLFGWLTDKLGVYKSALISFALILLVSILSLLRVLHSAALYIVSLSILWMNLGAWLSIAPTATGKLFDPKCYSRNYGILFSAYGTGAIIGTPLSGLIRTNFGSYEYIFIPTAALAVAGAAVAYFLLKPKTNTAKD